MFDINRDGVRYDFSFATHNKGCWNRVSCVAAVGDTARLSSAMNFNDEFGCRNLVRDKVLDLNLEYA